TKNHTISCPIKGKEEKVMPTLQEILGNKGVTLVLTKSNGEKPESVQLAAKAEVAPAVAVPATSYSFKRPKINMIVSSAPPAEIRVAVKKDIAEFRNEAETMIPDFVKRIVEAARTPETDEFFQRLQDDRRKLEAEIERLLALDPEYRNVVVVTYVLSLAQNAIESEAKSVFTRLVQIGFIARTHRTLDTTAPAGHVRFVGAEYELCPQFAKSPEAQMTIGALRRLVSANFKVGKEQKADKLALLFNEVAKKPMSVTDLKNDEKDGRILFYIPARPTERKKYPSGHVAFEVVFGKIKILGAVGGLETTANQIKDAGIFLRADMIYGGDLDSLHIQAENVWMLKTLRAWLIMGIQKVEEEEQKEQARAEREAKINAERQTLVAKATVSIDKILGRGNVGTAHLNWSELSPVDSFILKGEGGEEGPIPDLFFNFKRDRKGMVSVIEYPAWLEDVLGSYTEPRDPGPKYQNLGTLGIMLQAVYGKLVKLGRIDPNQPKPVKKQTEVVQPEEPVAPVVDAVPEAEQS
ncbi:MAG: hypothetical protein V2A55_01820, partial [Candidatus Jorgensenbacteria bacterium]